MKTLIAVGVLLCAATPAWGQWFPWASKGSSASAPTQTAVPPEFARVHPAVARIVAPGRGSISYGSGTLVKVDGQYGLVITNWHVVNEATGPVSVLFPDGFHSVGTVQKADRDWDLAAITIMRPNVEPVSLAVAAPQPDELLTIAGYGSGTYRAASGPCTQYVAPGPSFPFEMVELATTARQGDSGGPILNRRGELAGVLFGEGGGRTAGSYCGRVRWFLDSVSPSPPALQYGGATAVAQRAPATPVSGATGDLRPAHSATDGPMERFAATPPQVQNVVPVSQSRSGRGPAVTRLAGGEPGVSAPMTSAVAVGKRTTQSLGWTDIAGSTLSEQIKSVLAAIGGLAVILKTLRLVTRE